MLWSTYAERHASFIYRRHWTVILIATLFTLVAGYYVSKLRLNSDLSDLLPHDYPSVQTLERIKRVLGGVGNVRVLVTSDHPDRIQAFVDALVDTLNRNPLVHFVDYRVDKQFFRDHSLLYMDLEDLETVWFRIQTRITGEKLKQSPFYVDLGEGDESDDDADVFELEEKYKTRLDMNEYYVSADSLTFALDIYPTGTANDLAFGHRILEEVKQVVESVGPTRYDPKMEVEYAGQFRNRIDEYDILIEDIFGTLLYGLGAVLLLVTVYFRQPLTAFFLGIPLLMGLIWTFGITYGVIGSLNAITGFLFVVLFGLSIEFGVHLLYRYLESRRSGMGVEDALKLILSRTGHAMLTSGATTATAFLSLMITDFRGFSEFGFIMGLGYLLCLLSMLTVFPAFLVISERWRLLRKTAGSPARAVVKSGPMPMAWGILGIGVVLTVVSLALIPRLEFEYDFQRLRVNVPEAEKAKQKAGTIFTISQSPAVVLADSREDLDKIVEVLLQHMAADTLTPTIDTVRTVYAALPTDQEEKYSVMQSIKELLSEENLQFLKPDQREKADEFKGLLDARPIAIPDLPYHIRRSFTGLNGQIGNFVFIYPGVPLSQGQNAIRFAEDVRDIPVSSDKIYHSSSGQVILADVLLVMIRDSSTAVLATLFVIFVIVLLDFRSLRSALLVLVPLLVGIVWMCGGMVLLGMKINLFNMVVFPSIIGLSLDSGVHLFHRYREEGAGTLRKVVMTTGQAVMIGSLTTMLGFGDLILGRHPGLQSLGSLALLGLVTTLATALIIFPAALQVVEYLGLRRRTSS